MKTIFDLNFNPLGEIRGREYCHRKVVLVAIMLTIGSNSVTTILTAMLGARGTREYGERSYTGVWTGLLGHRHPSPWVFPRRTADEPDDEFKCMPQAWAKGHLLPE